MTIICKHIPVVNGSNHNIQLENKSYYLSKNCKLDYKITKMCVKYKIEITMSCYNVKLSKFSLHQMAIL